MRNRLPLRIEAAPDSMADRVLGLARRYRAAAMATAAANRALAIEEIEDAERYRAHSILAAALGTQEDSEAEAQLIGAHQALRKQLAELKPRQWWYAVRACERIVNLYEAAQQPDKVREWNVELAKVNAEIERLRNLKPEPEHDKAESDQADMENAASDQADESDSDQ